MSCTERISLSRIDRSVLTFRGFDHVGCHRCGCDDACCAFGCEVDKTTYDLIHTHRALVEDLLQVGLDRCFTHEWAGEPEFLGGDCTRTTVANGFCAFRMRAGKGCALYHLVISRGLPRRMIPSICRLYPLSWSPGELCLADDFYEKCNCLSGNQGTRSIIQSQWLEIEDIFELSGEARAMLLPQAQ